MRRHSRSLWIMTLSFATALFLALAGIYPNRALMAELNQETLNLKGKIETQRIIAPIYKELLKRSKRADLNGLAFPPEVIPAKSKDIDQFSKLIAEIAHQNKMTLTQITPDAESFLKETKFLGMNVSLNGDFFRFRQLLIQLCYIAFLKEIESIRIHIDNKEFKYDLRLVIAQEQEVIQNRDP